MCFVVSDRLAVLLIVIVIVIVIVSLCTVGGLFLRMKHISTSLCPCVQLPELISRYVCTKLRVCDVLTVATAAGVCGGRNVTRDCAGQCFGPAVIDDCQICTGGTTGHVYDGCDESCFADADRCKGVDNGKRAT